MNLLDWTSLGLLEKIFAVIGITASVLIALQILFSLVAGDAHHDFEVDAEHGDMGHAWGMFSVRGMLGLMLGVGWGGLIALQRGFNGVVSTLIGVAGGLVIAFCLGMLMRFFHAMRSDGTTSLRNAIGQTASVYQRVPSKRDGIGKVQVMVQGRLQTLEACTDAEADLMPGKQVKVTEVVAGGTLLVE